MPRLGSDAAPLLLRIVAGAIFLPHGWSKIAADGGAAAFAADMSATYGIPSFLGYVAAYAEVFGAVLLVAGLFTRLDALLLAGTMFVAAFIVQLPDALYEVPPGAGKVFLAIRGIELPLAMLAICLALVMTSGGRFALDHLLAQWWGKKKTAAEAAVVRAEA